MGKFLIIFLSILIFLGSIKLMSLAIKLLRNFLFFAGFILLIFSIVAFIIGIILL